MKILFIALAGFWLLLMMPLIYPAVKRCVLTVKNKRDGNPLAETILSLLDQPGWVISEYHATHRTGVSIWIANTPDSAGITIDGTRAGPIGTYGNMIDVGPYWKRQIRSRIDRLKLETAARALSEQEAAFANNVINFATALRDKQERQA